MTNGMYDQGRKRQFYQIINAFVPGQTYNYSTSFSRESRSGRRRANLTVRTIKLKNARSEENKNDDIIFWSGNRIKKRIREGTGISDDVHSLKLIRLDEHPDAGIKVEFGVYPRTYILRQGEKVFITWTAPDVSTTQGEISQAQFVFCNSDAIDDNKAIHTFRVEGKDLVELAYSDQASWLDQRILMNDQLYPIALGYKNNPESFQQIRAEYEKYSSGWKFKPILSSSKVVFSPVNMSDVHYPMIDSKIDVIYYLLKQKGIDKVDIKGQLKYLMDSNILEKASTEEIPGILNGFMAAFLDDGKRQAKVIVDNWEYINSEELKEKYKLSKLENLSSKKIKRHESEPYLKEYGINSVAYLEPVECVEMCIGWTSGKFDPGTNDGQAILHGIRASVKGKDISYDPYDKDWSILYHIVDSEGLLFRFKENLDFDARHTFAHLLLKVLPEFCGIEEGSLSEQIFEKDPSILIYSREPGEFRTYGIKHVFDNSLQDLLESAKDFIECPFDNDKKDGCYYCLHKPVGCEYFNLHLDKSSLNGIW